MSKLMASLTSSLRLGRIRSQTKRRVKNDPNSTCVDSAIRILEQNPSFEFGSSVLAGLRYIKEFLIYAQNLRNECAERLETVVSGIEDGFETAGVELECSLLKGDAERFQIQSKLEKKIRLFKAKIKNTYDHSTSATRSRKKESWNYHSWTDVGDAMDKIMDTYHLYDEEEWKSVGNGFALIKIFLSIAHEWNDKYHVIFNRVGKDVLHTIVADFKKAGHKIENAITRGDAEGLDALQVKFLEKIEKLKPRIREAYDILSFNIFETTPPLHFAFFKFKDWGYFCNAMVFVAENVLQEYDLRTEIASIMRAIECIGNVYKLQRTTRTKNPGFLIQGISVVLARLLFLCYINQMDEESMVRIISDLLQRIRPTLYLTIVWFSEEDRRWPVGIIFPGNGSLVERLRGGLMYLLKPTNLKLLESDIQNVVSDVSSLDYSYLRAAGDDDELLFQYLQRIELLRVELVMLNITAGSESISAETFESIYEILTFLMECSDSEKLVFILQRIEQSVWQLQIDQDEPYTVLKFKLYIEFKVLKIQAFLMEQMKCSPTLLVDHEFHSLNQELELLYKGFSLLPCMNQGDEQLITALMERMETPPYYFRLSDHVANGISDFVSTMLQMVQLMNSEIQHNLLEFRRSLVLTFPSTHQGLGFADMLLEKLGGLMLYKADSIGDSMKQQIMNVIKEVESLRCFLGVERNDDQRVTRAVYEAEYLIDWILMVKCDWNLMIWLSDVIDEMRALNFELTTFVQKENDSSQVFEQAMVTRDADPKVGEIVVALEDQECIVIGQLTRSVSRRREVVTIFGMPGIGKTTLAKKVYDHPQIKNHFHVLAWCCVSQVYRTRELLLKILGDLTKSNTDEMDKKTDDDLLDMLYKGLKGRRYCIVMDDVWSSQVWEELRFAFPDDKNGSRILITTRNEEVSLSVEPGSVPHTLRFLREGESWKLLREIIFHGDECPKGLLKVGMEIARGCKGLPMAIVAIAGLLKTSEKNVALWEKIERDLNAHILESPEIQCMHILELSYNHLPDGLKPCFQYFAAFGEDNEVPVQKLIRLWLAEGFVGKVQGASAEDVAESYVVNLVGRSLLMVAKTGSSGKVKACKVHDMVYHLCLRKAEEKKFLQYIDGYKDFFPSSDSQLDYGVDSEFPPISIAYDQHRVSICSKRNQFVTIKPSGPSARTLLFSATSDTYPRCPYDEISFITDKFKILSILDIENINIGSSFPKGIELVYSLRYLAIGGDIRSIPSTIAKLWNLESFLVKGLIGKVAIPDTIWSMSKLRHLHVSTQAILSLKDGRLESSAQLDNMVSLSCPGFSNGDNSEEVMKLFPKLRKLKCTFSGSTDHSEITIYFPVLEFLEELESLKIMYYGSTRYHCQLHGRCFPSHLKKLSLSQFRLTWDDFSTIGILPNLSILKLVSVSFDSPVWEMKEDEFKQLEYLKLDSIKISEWYAENDHLPNLKQLVLRSCIRLKEVPYSFGEIDTLEMVELKWCSVAAEMSVTEILEQQLAYGNDIFKAFVNGFVVDPKSSTEDSSSSGWRLSHTRSKSLP